jgi:phage baseplate assembly protein V
MNFDFSELDRRLSNLIRIGEVSEADYEKALVRVSCDDLTTDWLPWLTRRAGGDIDWWAPEVGEQVIVLAPSGLIEAAIVIPALYSDARPEPRNSPEKRFVRFADGATFEYDRAAHKLEIAIGATRITATRENVRIESPRIDLNP